MNISILRRPLVGAFFVPKIWKIDEKKRVRDDRVDIGTLDFGRQRDDARIGRVAGNRAQIIAATGGARDLNLPRLRQNFSLARNASGVISGARRGGQRKKKREERPTLRDRMESSLSANSKIPRMFLKEPTA